VRIDVNRRFEMSKVLLAGLIAVTALTGTSCTAVPVSQPSGVDAVASPKSGVVVPGGYIEYEDHPRSGRWYW
jgi:hypothetical protein